MLGIIEPGRQSTTRTSIVVDVCFLNGLDVLKILSDPKKQIYTFPVILLNFA